MEIIFPIMENKSSENQIFVESSSELLFSLLESARTILIKDFKKQILDIFMGNVSRQDSNKTQFDLLNLNFIGLLQML
jgi:hypothetical protein